MFQARSTEDGMDFYVDQEALGEVAGSLLRDLTSQKSAAKNCGTEFGLGRKYKCSTENNV